MRKPNTAKATPEAVDLRQRAARARDAAGRFIKRAPLVENATPPAEPRPSKNVEPDPALVVASVFRTCWDALGKVLDAEVPDELSQPLSDAQHAAYQELRSVRPTTPAGYRALAECWAMQLKGERGEEEGITLADDAADSLIAGAGASVPINDVDWYATPPGFMASPAIEPFSFVRIPDGIAIELGRLRGIAFAELNRRTSPETKAQEIERLRRELHLDVLAGGAGRRSGSAVDAGPPNLIGMLDLASATIDELRAIQDIAEHVGAVAYAYTWGPRCGTRAGPFGAIEQNGIGRLMHWLGDALTDVESAVDKEVARRAPDIQADRETRLSMLAVPIINDGGPDAIEAFARELLDLAAAERRGH